MFGSDTCVVYNNFPNELLLALCFKERKGYSIEKLENLKDVNCSNIIMFSNYNRLGAKENISFKIYAGTPDLTKDPESTQILGPWIDFSKESSLAFLAYSYWKSLSFDDQVLGVRRSFQDLKQFELLCDKGKIYYEKEVSIAKYVASKSVRVKMDFRLVTIGMSAGIHVVHLEMAKIQPTVNGTLVHYIINEDGKLINRWSFKALTQDMIDRGNELFNSKLKCSEFGPPQEKVSIGDLRGGRDGLDFVQGLQALNNNNYIIL